MINAATGPVGCCPGSTVRRHIPFLVVVCLLVWAAPAGLWDLQGNDEGRYVQIAKELLPRGDWLRLTLHGVNYDQKPPLPFWMFAAMMKLAGGVSTWAVRLPGALSGTLTVVLTYLLGRFLLNTRYAFCSALLLMSAPVFFSNAPQAELNMIFTGFITLALYAWLARPEDGSRLSWGRALLLWGAVAGAFFVKGPLALVIVAAAIGGEALACRSWQIVRAARPLIGLVAVIGMVAAWMAVQSHNAGTEFVRGQLKSELYTRLFVGVHSAPPWFYLMRIFVGFFPWAFFLVPACIHTWKHRRTLSPRIVALGICFLFSFVFLSFVPSKRVAYLLPLYPAMALLTGFYLVNVLSLDRPAPAWLRLAMAYLLAGVAAAMLGMAVLRMEGHGWVFSWTLAGGGIAYGAFAGLALAVVRRRTTLWKAGAVLTATLISVLFVHEILVKPTENTTMSSRAFSARVDALADLAMARGDVAVLGGADEPRLHVYGNYRPRLMDVKRDGTLVEKQSSGRFVEAQSLPPVVIALSKETPRLAGFLPSPQWTQAWDGKVAEEDVTVFVRRP